MVLLSLLLHWLDMYAVTPNMVDYSASKTAAIAFHEELAVELVMSYNVPKLCTVLVTHGFTRTSLIDDVTLEDTWVDPLLHTGTAADELVNRLLKAKNEFCWVD